MQILKKINNNVVLALDDKGQEIIAVGKGLGFTKTPYELSDTGLIEHIFVNARNNKILEAFYELPTEHIILAEKIIKIGKDMLQKELNKNILLTLSDHLSFAIERKLNSIAFDFPLQMDIQFLYPDEAAVGKMAIAMVKSELGIELPKNESSMMAMHFISAEYDLNGMQETYQLTDTISTIIRIVEEYFDTKLDETSIYYLRFATHLRYFVIRQKKGIRFPEESNSMLREMVEDKDKKISGCVEKIHAYIQKKYGWICSQEEQIYLMIHLNYLILYKDSKGEEL